MSAVNPVLLVHSVSRSRVKVGPRDPSFHHTPMRYIAAHNLINSLETGVCTYAKKLQLHNGSPFTNCIHVFGNPFMDW
ncbi:hypothetical protein K1719_044099 [Acacia pycnantha]|nr:hypothetical protein K1719_044099 [Acacia pycnantha]